MLYWFTLVASQLTPLISFSKKGFTFEPRLFKGNMYYIRPIVNSKLGISCRGVEISGGGYGLAPWHKVPGG